VARSAQAPGQGVLPSAGADDQGPHQAAVGMTTVWSRSGPTPT
jgi:hypothetical protein